MRYAISLGLLMLALTVASCAQDADAPRGDVAVGYSPLYILKGYTIWMNGGSASASFDVNNWLGVVGDFGGYVGHVPETISGETYMAGPRFYYRKLRSDRLVPFGQALFGGSHFSESTGGITGGGSQFTFALGGGADIALGSSSKFALRPAIEYVGIQSSGSTTSAARFSIGIVYRFGKK
jgi:hypothetical protein